LGSIAQQFNSMPNGANAAFWLAVPQIVLINLLLSGDTAVVIAMACRGLPPRQRAWGMALGAGTAATLLVLFAVLIAPLLSFPYVKLLGGVALIYIAVKLVVSDDAGRDVPTADRLWRVVRIIAVADVVLSLDNIIAVVAVARGDLALLVIGLGVSIPILLAGAAVIGALLDRFPLLVWVGAALFGWIAGDIMATDSAVFDKLTENFGEHVARQLALAAAGAGAILVIAVAALLRRRANNRSG
jgi:YjbE family integral membrane protein